VRVATIIAAFAEGFRVSPSPRRSEVKNRICQQCGRVITYRKKWKHVWDRVKFCSSACRRARLTPTDHKLEAAILDLLRQRARDASICPSEAARSIGGVGDRGWKTLCERARRAARRLAGQGIVEITQGGAGVDPSRAKGPIRIRLSRRR
jgi:hypothetical protein